jgi:tetratricopeptide (TPR) repeat protein
VSQRTSCRFRRLPYAQRQYRERRQDNKAWRARRLWSIRRAWSRLPPKSDFFTRTTQYRSEPASILIWSVLSLIVILLLGAFAVLLAHDTHTDPKGIAHPFPGVASPWRPIALTITRGAVAGPLVFALLLALAWTTRRALLARLVWRGARILVPMFEEGSKLSTTSTAQLTALFRERLVLLRLQSAAPSPGAAAEGAFLDVLSAGAPSNDVFSTLLRLLRAAVPSHAIEVQGVVRERSQEPKYGVTVQVSQRPSQTSPVIVVWASSWTRATREAADGATAAILPRTRLCKGPWATWRGYRMPPQLLTAYEDAAEYEQDRCFDEALDRYWEALRLDPMNLTVRLHLGQLQEKVGHPLAALTNYQRILAFGNPGGENLPRGLFARRARREWERALILAKYRAIVLLAEGSIVLEWSRVRPRGAPAEDDPTKVKKDFEKLEQLREEFEKVLKPLAGTERHDPAAELISHATRELLEAERCLTSEGEVKLRRKLMACVFKAAEDLKLSLSRTELRPSSRPLTRRTVALTQMCIERRCELLGTRPFDDASYAQLNREIRWAGSRPGPLLGWWPSFLRRWQWHEHYSAACAYAIPLDRDTIEKTLRGKIARRAVQRLERAITSRDGEFVETWQDWILSEDPDLDGLRKEPAFRAFQTMYFPTSGPVRVEEDRNARPHRRLTESRYTRDLLAEIAQRRHHAWHARAQEQSDTHHMRDWCDEERDIWRLLRDVAATREDWRVRQLLVKRINQLHSGEDPIAVRFIGPEEYPAALRGSENDSAWLASADKHMDHLVDLLDQAKRAEAGAKPTHFDTWIDAMDRLPIHPPAAVPAGRRARLCERHAETWQELRTGLLAEEPSAAPGKDVPPRFESFTSELGTTAELWMGSHNGSIRAKLRHMWPFG